MYQQTDELMHYGVPGMKWGRRKTNKISSSKKKKKTNKKKKKKKSPNVIAKKNKRWINTYMENPA